MGRIRLTIDRLVLEGLRPGDGARIAGALRTELGRQLGDPAAAADLARQADRPELTVAPLRPVEGTSPAALGRATGRAIGERLRR